jgi:hypothetical protein
MRRKCEARWNRPSRLSPYRVSGFDRWPRSAPSASLGEKKRTRTTSRGPRMSAAGAQILERAAASAERRLLRGGAAPTPRGPNFLDRANFHE